MIKNYNEYILKMLLEQVASKELPLFFSPRFASLLESISHPIAKKLLDNELNGDIMVKKTYIDLSDEKTDEITFINTSKAVTLVTNKSGKKVDNLDYFHMSRNPKSDVYNNNRVSMKINKFVNQIFPNEFKPSGEPGNDMESFVNLFKSKRTIGTFELIKGDDIVKYYNEEYYAETSGGGSLSNSCMRYDTCSNYIEFYANNPDKISMLILRDDIDNTKIKGRAIVWKLYKPEDRVFMDRIYTFYDSDVDKFKGYAKENGWLYKSKQNMSESVQIIDTKTDTFRYMSLFVDGLNDNDNYPYMDTLKYFEKMSGMITNEEGYFDECYKLEDVSGEYEYINNDFDDDDRRYIDYYGETLELDDLYWCENVEDYRKSEDSYWSEHYNCYNDTEYAEHNMLMCYYALVSSDKYRNEGDCVYLNYYNKYATNEYLESDKSEFVHNDFDDEYILKDDAVWSEYHNTNLNKNIAYKVYTSADRTKTDWRSNNKITYFSHDGELYADTVNKKDIK